MGLNYQFLPHTVLDTAFNSVSIPVPDAGLIHVQARFTGDTCSFTATIEVTADPSPTEDPLFDPYPGAAKIITEAGSFSWLIDGCGVSQIRLAITAVDAGNDGTIAARVNIKGPGI